MALEEIIFLTATLIRIIALIYYLPSNREGEALTAHCQTKQEGI